MIEFKDNETIEEVEEEYDYMNEEPLEEEDSYEDEEENDIQCE